MLVTPQLFDRLTARIRADHPEHAHQAENIMVEALAFLAACAANPGAGLGPSELVDIGWHTFLMYTEEYARFSARVAGRFIHHQPDDVPGQTGSGAGLAATVKAIKATGYRVNPALWPSAGDCSSGGGDKCSQCYAGCADTPK
ncbi:hypothetical protein ABZ815_39485 [Nonomuraea sp. NPDC047529]|uniref:glycine-rich domain-containing protein n=1 Tax=Nonomuraea sp. NPDC047529 TaxID=3155623 RepID=UPI0033F6FD60